MRLASIFLFVLLLSSCSQQGFFAGTVEDVLDCIENSKSSMVSEKYTKDACYTKYEQKIDSSLDIIERLSTNIINDKKHISYVSNFSGKNVSNYFISAIEFDICRYDSLGNEFCKGPFKRRFFIKKLIEPGEDFNINIENSVSVEFDEKEVSQITRPCNLKTKFKSCQSFGVKVYVFQNHIQPNFFRQFFNW